MDRRTAILNVLGTTAAVALAPAVAAAIASPALKEASGPDPIFAVIDAHRRANSELTKTLVAWGDAEDELQAAGDLYPSVESVGNRYSGLPPIRSRTHAEIDLYSPADMYPDRNASEHAELQASIERRAARARPIEDAQEQAMEVETTALFDLLAMVPTTMPGVFALVSYLHHEMDEGRPAAEHFELLCGSLLMALERLNPSAVRGTA